MKAPAALAALLLTTAASAGNISGVGTNSCGRYLELRGTAMSGIDTTVVTWSQGFLAAMSIAGVTLQKKQPIDIPDPASLVAYIDKFCRDNPLKKVWESTLMLYYEIDIKS